MILLAITKLGQYQQILLQLPLVLGRPHILPQPLAFRNGQEQVLVLVQDDGHDGECNGLLLPLLWSLLDLLLLLQRLLRQRRWRWRKRCWR